jgi:hypothetical protein
LVSTVVVFLASNFKVLHTSNIELQSVVLDHVSTSESIVTYLTPSVIRKRLFFFLDAEIKLRDCVNNMRAIS